MRINQAGIDLIKRFETCVLSAYKDVRGIWTIGWGSTGPDVIQGLKIDPETANELLAQDLGVAERCVSKYVIAPLTDNQFSALVSFVFNVGGGNFKTSTMLRLLNKKDYAGASEQFARWNKSGGKVWPGLTRRREAERLLFLS